MNYGARKHRAHGSLICPSVRRCAVCALHCIPLADFFSASSEQDTQHAGDAERGQSQSAAGEAGAIHVE